MRGVDGVAFEPGSHRLAVVRSGEVLVLDTDRPARRAERLFASGGSLSGVTWSPDGRWLLVGWPAADQWIFVRADGRRIRAVSNVSEQFRSQTFPRVEGWCCAK
jgi:WD40 repeat protein